MNTEKIWARGTTIETLNDFKTYGCQLTDLNWLGSEKKSRSFIERFLSQVIYIKNSLNDAIIKDVLNELFARETFPNCDSVRTWVEGDWSNYITRLQLNDKEYLDYGDGNTSSPKTEDYLNAVEEFVREHHLKDTDIPPAMARITVLCMILVRLPKDLSDSICSAMLSDWLKDEEVDEVKDRQEYSFLDWENLPDNMQPKRKILKNSGTSCRECMLKSPYGEQTILIPPSSQLTALFVEDNMISLKGFLSANGSMVASLYKGKFQKYNVTLDILNDQTLKDSAIIQDFSLSDSGRIHILQNSNATIWENISNATNIQNMLGIFSVERVWVLLGKDGKTSSNIDCLDSLDAVVVTQTADNILVLDTKNTVHSLKSETTFEPIDVWNTMMSRFQNLPKDAVEQISFKNKQFVKKIDGTIECLKKAVVSSEKYHQ